MTTETNKTKSRYIEAVGRRKTAVARVRLTEAAKNQFVVNDRELNVYFPTGEMQEVVTESFSKSKVLKLSA